MPEGIHLRRPTLDDGRRLWDVARRSGALDLNSPYAYVLLSTHFAETSLVAERDGDVVGFVAAYRPPTEPDALFVWQVAVDADARQGGLGLALLDAAAQRAEADDGLRWVLASVTPSNTPSCRLFRSLATSLGAAIEVAPWIEEEHFPGDQDHEAERLVRIGPIPDRTDDLP